MPILRGKTFVLCTLLMPALAWGYDFVPTRLEYTAWPKYCQARYVETNIGRRSEFVNSVSAAERRAAEASIGSETYLHVHHHCAGLAWLARARVEPDPRRREHMLNRARDESMYTFRNVTPSSPLYSSIAANLAWVEKLRGDIPLAEGHFQTAMKAKPTDPMPYVGLAILYRDTKRLGLARETLEKGLAATDGQSVDIHYNLGLICLELDDQDCAVEHARAAYSAGYPLPGLKQKLSKLNLWNE